MADPTYSVWELADLLLEVAASPVNGTPLETLRNKLAESTLGGQRGGAQTGGGAAS